MNSLQKMQLMYILPNLFTAASAFLGVISVISSIQGNYTKAIIYVVLSLVLDGLDGRVARLTKTTSKFGVEFDSLADLVAFGVAPAILFYIVIGVQFGKFGALIAAMFVVFGAIRLARFNVTTGTYEPNVFIGLPIPTAAIVSVLWIGVYLDYEILQGFEWFYVLLQSVLAVLMVSNIRYPSFKKMNLKQTHVMRILVVLVVAFSMLYLYPFESATIVMSVYTLYGIIRAAIMFSKNSKKKESE
ncbi:MULTISPECIES: CDP-diacylglycerol--serine O-phosphatidyltransferase [Campylobacter]|uniref:CDP-diacylglycerol--serine O-phosphatidyltransferase n=1 Tax=Campylobacter curvus (strain 525.92) TaxID=360105 RepID=A7GWY4_CAMC5|nr:MULTISPECIES: CDP-diacylglycerol--serine O-phosphatidyltransferase [Campylobacter]EAU00917.2 phosphatidylserine synthase [Campylobacter curvus 525.92]EJP74681.1 CDP-diacylglycerol-serine O-phosphatidyltransferase [Campylobacter sp. FOBRC14]MBN7287332.1 CDP-diacylglycerol--serine O-phosphatidyltransferase [Campylobacter curvus]MDU6826756.1 CDP-diacylglycerol--serine O-phosphatidyltransferase [Campylobacter sp.]QKF60737.1 phosphatidylserine synthase [Campylobacter curvus]